jgi:uncharacterized protein (TIGR03000 family)
MAILSWSARFFLVLALISWSALPSEGAKGGGGGGGHGGGGHGGGGGGSRSAGGFSRGSSGSWGNNNHNHGQHHSNGGYGYGFWPGFGYGYFYPGYGFSSTPIYRSSYYSGGDYQEEETVPVGERANITLKVPADAEVWFNNRKTQQTGKERQYVTPPLEAGYTYSYQLWASWTENGKTITRTRDISVSPGENIMVEIRGPAPEKP